MIYDGGNDLCAHVGGGEGVGHPMGLSKYLPMLGGVGWGRIGPGRRGIALVRNTVLILKRGIRESGISAHRDFRYKFKNGNPAKSGNREISIRRREIGASHKIRNADDL